MISEAFDTAIEDCGDELAGPWREPKQMPAAQEYASVRCSTGTRDRRRETNTDLLTFS